jgi:riboflavin kinase/FMN adenylyltransferase
MKSIIIGRDYKFGKNRRGSVDLLKEYEKSFPIEVIVADWVPVTLRHPDRISSTRIRETVMAGRVEDACHLLGRYYQIRGEVVTGRKRGGPKLGFPTANIRLVDELCPKTGVYAVTVLWKGKKFKGVANIGYSPTFDDHMFTVEVHLFDFQEDIYGETIRVNFVKRIRDEKKFSGISELSRQIRGDCESARSILAGL